MHASEQLMALASVCTLCWLVPRSCRAAGWSNVDAEPEARAAFMQSLRLVPQPEAHAAFRQRLRLVLRSCRA
eukprot:363424-Chlamydomonas_euryale.AAC.13